MKKSFILLFLSCGLCYTILSGNAAGPGTVNGVNVTTTGCNCHSTSATTAIGVTVQLLSGTTPVTAYTPGGSYTIRLTGTNTSTSFTLPRFGFQLSATKTTSATTNAGTLTAPSGSHVATVSGVKIVEQSAATVATTGTGGNGTTYVVNIPWTAPATGTGGVTIKAVLNAINFNSSADAGDKWNTATLAVTETPGAAIATTNAGDELNVFPNPSKGSFSIKLPASDAEPAYIVITDMAGMQVKTLTATTPVTNFTSTLPVGMYLLSATTAMGNYTSRIVIE